MESSKWRAIVVYEVFTGTLLQKHTEQNENIQRCGVKYDCVSFQSRLQCLQKTQLVTKPVYTHISNLRWRLVRSPM